MSLLGEFVIRVATTVTIERLTMKAVTIAMTLAAALMPMVAPAQTAPAPATEPSAAAKGYTTTGTSIGTLLANPDAKAVVERHFPGLSTADSIQMAATMTLRQLQQFKPDLFTDKALAETDADLAKVAVK